MCCSADCFLGFLAILFPPLAVWVKRGLCSADSIINILLCVLGYIPGLLHAWYIIAKFPDTYEDYDRVPQNEGGEDGRVTYVFVNQPPRPQRQPKAQHQTPPSRNYGTTNASSSSAPQQHQSGEGSSNNNPPPSYAEAIQGDNKIQTQD